MELATTALSSLLPKLGTLLEDEYKLQKGLRGQIMFLKAEMEIMQAVLEKLSIQPADRIDNLDKIWMRNLKELSYDIEDSVDKFMVHVDAPAKPPSLNRFRRFIDKIGFLNKAKNRHKIAIDIEDIKRRIHEVDERRKMYNFNGATVQPVPMAMDPRMPALYEDVKMLVAIDGPAQKLITLLTEGNGVQKEKLRVVSIVGVGGLGKTTLANSVYKRLKGGFECQAFVSVSLRPNIEKIFSSILRQVSGKEYANAEAWSHTELIDKIRQIIEKKRYIIVIDDLWDVSAWRQINCALIDNDCGSRVIVTTRNLDVAKYSCSPINGSMYELAPLSHADSERLFYKRISSAEEGIYSEMKEVTTKILKKCGGVPLAIITIASVLANMRNKTKFEWYDVYNSMGFGLEKHKTLENMREILYLSYVDLPSYLKPCLLYLSIFPEDYLIGRDGLVRMWIAEGFVAEKQGINLYELGKGYFNELLNRSMIQPVNVDENGSARACRVHDMILDLIISVSSQENFVSISGLKAKFPECKVRRLSLHGSKVIHPETVDMSHVRSLIAFEDACRWIPPLSSSVLRVLSLKRSHGHNNSHMDLSTLYHLRYLELGGQLETGLLEDIGNLQHLKILDLSNAIIQLPASIVQLKQLECLILGEGVEIPAGNGILTFLQDLPMVFIQTLGDTLVELSKLTKARVLKIYTSGKKSLQKPSFDRLTNLGQQTLCDHQECSLDGRSGGLWPPEHIQCFINASGFTFSKVPQWFRIFSELSSLSITVNMLRQDGIQLLGALPLLRFLKLTAHNGTEGRLVIGINHPFCSLEEFRFDYQYAIGDFLVSGQGVMPKLQRLQLRIRPARRGRGGIHIGLENLTCLKHISFQVECSCVYFCMSEVEDLEAKARDVISTHPNHPTHDMSRCNED